LVKQVTFWGIILFVDKNDDMLRLCIDNCALNKISIKNNYPLPHIDDMLDQLNGAKYFIPIYVTLRYYQIRIANGDIQKMVMRTNYGLYEFLMMPFGLCNAPSTFTTFMNSIFHKRLDEFVIIYIDNILVYSKTT
jgi:hypothetical protein